MICLKISSVLFVPSGGIVPLNQLAPDTLHRCQKALELWRTNQSDKILVAGGICHSPEIQTVSAAELMKKWFTERGVDEKSIIVEPESLHTYDNIRLGLEKLKAAQIENPEITVVTQWQHTIRCWLTFKLGYGINVKRHPLHYPVPSNVWWREWAFIAYHALDWKGTGFFAKRMWLRREQS